MMREAHGRERVRPVPNGTTPYWRSELHRLDEYRSTPKLPEECDIVVIGAGMSGVAFIYHMLKMQSDGPDPSIVLLEARQVCSGATGRNGGHIKIPSGAIQSIKESHGLEAAEEIAAYLRDQIYAIKDVVETENLECEFELRRSFTVFMDETKARCARRDFEASVANGEKWTHELCAVPQEHIEKITSIIGAKYALSTPACSFWPYKFVTSLLSTLIQRINLQTNTMVTDVLSLDGEGYDVCTPRGIVRAKKVVFASNGYTSGICRIYENVIVPYKGCNSHITTVQQEAPSPHLCNTYNIGYPTHTDYLNPRPAGGITVGGAHGVFGHDKSLWFDNWDDSSLISGVTDYFSGYMQRTFKGWERTDAEASHIWTGIMGRTEDGFPHVGKVPGHENQFILAGYNGGGMTQILLAARGLAKIVRDGVAFADTGIPRWFETSTSRLQGMTDHPPSH